MGDGFFTLCPTTALHQTRRIPDEIEFFDPTRRAPPRRCRESRGYSHSTTAMHDIQAYPHPSTTARQISCVGSIFLLLCTPAHTGQVSQFGGRYIDGQCKSCICSGVDPSSTYCLYVMYGPRAQLLYLLLQETFALSPAVKPS